jgi:hypothetical protein
MQACLAQALIQGHLNIRLRKNHHFPLLVGLENNIAAVGGFSKMQQTIIHRLK